MDTWRGNLEEWNLGVEELIFRLSVMGVTIVIFCFFCCYCLWSIPENSSNSDNMDRREIPGLELRVSNYEESLGINIYRHQPEPPSLGVDNIAFDVNDGIGNASDSGEATSVSIIEDDSDEEVIYNACNAGVHSDGTFRIEKNSDMQCSSKDLKDTSVSNNTNRIENGEPYVANVTVS